MESILWKGLPPTFFASSCCSCFSEPSLWGSMSFPGQMCPLSCTTAVSPTSLFLAPTSLLGTTQHFLKTPGFFHRGIAQVLPRPHDLNQNQWENLSTSLAWKRRYIPPTPRHEGKHRWETHRNERGRTLQRTYISQVHARHGEQPMANWCHAVRLSCPRLSLPALSTPKKPKLPGEYRGSANVVGGNREGKLIRTLFPSSGFTSTANRSWKSGKSSTFEWIK